MPQPVRGQSTSGADAKKSEWTRQEKALQRILAVLLWPVTVTYWFYENRAIKLERNARIGVICAAWALFIAAISGVVFLASQPKIKVNLDYSVSTTTVVSTAQPATTTTQKQTTAATTKPTTTVNSIFS